MTDAASTELERLELRDHTPEQFTTALMTLVMSGGNASKAARVLRGQGIKVNKTTLLRWRELYPQRFREVQKLYSEKLEADLVNDQRALALTATRASYAHVEAAEEQRKAGKTKDAAKASQALQTVAGIAVDKMTLLTGRPTVITQPANTSEILKRIAERIGGTVIVDAEVVDDSPDSRAGLPQLEKANGGEPDQ